MKKDKQVRLYSAFFPFYGFLAGNFKDFPWMMAANLAILALVSFLVLRLSKAQDWKRLVPKVTARAFVTGLLADGAALFARFLPTLAEMLLRLLGFQKAAQYLGKFVSDFTWYQIWSLSWNKIGLPWTIGSILLAGVFAFVFNYFVMLKKAVPEKKLRLVLSICLAVFSAPYSWTNPAW